LAASAVAEPIQPTPIAVVSATVIRAAIHRAGLPDVLPMAHLVVLSMADLVRIADKQLSSVTWL
jgi:hypothetical protein